MGAFYANVVVSGWHFLLRIANTVFLKYNFSPWSMFSRCTEQYGPANIVDE